jgi:hypothetical protein
VEAIGDRDLELDRRRVAGGTRGDARLDARRLLGAGGRRQQEQDRGEDERAHGPSLLLRPARAPEARAKFPLVVAPAARRCQIRRALPSREGEGVEDDANESGTATPGSAPGAVPGEDAKTDLLAVRVSADVISAIDAFGKVLERDHPGITFTRSALVRLLLTRGLEQVRSSKQLGN